MREKTRVMCLFDLNAPLLDALSEEGLRDDQHPPFQFEYGGCVIPAEELPFGSVREVARVSSEIILSYPVLLQIKLRLHDAVVNH